MEDVVREQLIEQLKPIVNEPEFDKIFAMLTADMSGPERFRLKAELRDLATPCNRQVDLRKRVYGEVRAYNFKGQVHYMDEIAIRIFEEGLDRYQGVFTEDTYQQIYQAENNIRVVQETEKQLALQAQQQGLPYQPNTHAKKVQKYVQELQHDASIAVPYFTFGRYMGRREERMNYAANIHLLIGSKKLEAVTADISVSGIRLRLKAAQVPLSQDDLKQGTQILVFFTGLSQEFTLDVNTGILYQLVGHEKKTQGTYLRLVRSIEQANDEFDAFLSKFISGYKHRYKVNIDNIYTALMSKAHEQLYLPKMSGVPLFFKREQQRMYPVFALENKENRKVLDAWLDEQNHCMVAGLFSGKRLARCLQALQNKPKGVVTDVIYAFQVMRNNQAYFYSAFASELLQNPALKALFLGYASRRAHFKVYQFTFAALDIGKAWIPSTVPLDVLEAQGDRVRPPSPEVMKNLEGLTHVGVMTEIEATANLYPQAVLDAEKLNQLNALLHPRRGLAPLKRTTLDIDNVRSESRFNYRSLVRIQAEKHEQLGMMRDFSTTGLQVQVEREMDVKVGDVLQVSLPELAKRFKDFDLRKLPYRIVHISGDGTTYHLQREGSQEHLGQRFFRYIIQTHYQALKRHEQTGTVKGVELCLRNLYCHALTHLVLFLQKPRAKPLVISRAGVSSLNEPIKNYCLEVSFGPELSLQPILSEVFLKQELERYWTEAQSTGQLSVIWLVRREIDKGVLRTYRLELPEQPNEEERLKIQAFLNAGQAAGDIHALQINGVKAGKPDTEFIAKELNYLQSYASHRADEFEREVWDVVGFLEVMPITDDVLLRFS